MYTTLTEGAVTKILGVWRPELFMPKDVQKASAVSQILLVVLGAKGVTFRKVPIGVFSWVKGHGKLIFLPLSIW